jgi:hypothetical protein
VSSKHGSGHFHEVAKVTGNVTSDFDKIETNSDVISEIVINKKSVMTIMNE